MSLSHNKKKKVTVISLWKDSLRKLIIYYENHRGSLKTFFPALFMFFVFLNISCYWLAMLTAYPQHAFGNESLHYFLVQFPVGFLGAVFDSLSFFVTIYIAKKALKTTTTVNYIAHLSIDFIIAVLATWWVLFVFSVSGWIIGIVLQQPESLAARNYVYEQRFVEAINEPTKRDNLKNIYFGVVMGISAMLPTFTHLSMSVYSVFQYLFKKKMNYPAS